MAVIVSGYCLAASEGIQFKKSGTSSKITENDTIALKWGGINDLRQAKQDWTLDTMKEFGSKLAVILTSPITEELLKYKYGSFEDWTYTMLYEKPAKNVAGSVHCPVDVYIYDSAGTLCGSIVNDKIDAGNGSVVLYAEGDEKYFNLAGDDYQIRFVGYASGVMDYELNEYRDGELMRTLRYGKIPLEAGLEYSATIPEIQMADSLLYNPWNTNNGSMVFPASDVLTAAGVNNGTGASQYGDVKPSQPSIEPTQTPDATPTPEVTQPPVASATIAPTLMPTQPPVSTLAPPVTVEPEDVPGDILDDRKADILTAAKVIISKKSYIYNGKQRKPKVIAETDSGYLDEDIDYIVSYKNNIRVGKASVIIKGIGNYTGKIIKTFKILPKGTSFSKKIKVKNRAFMVKWKKGGKSVTGYQLQCSTS